MFFNDDELSGGWWRAGFTASPGRRGSIRLEYGERFGGDFIDASAFYELSRRLVFSAGASRTFQTRSQNISSRFRGNQLQTLEFADRLRDGEELPARGVIDAANRFASSLSGRSAQTIGVGVTDQAFAALDGRYGRTQVTLSGNYTDSDFGFRTIESLGGSFNLRHQLSRTLTGYIGVDYRHVDTTFDPAVCEVNPLIFGFDTTDPLFNAMTDCAALAADNGVTDTVIGRLGGSYRIAKNVSAFAEYSHTERFSEVDLLEYGENTILAGVTLDF